MADLEQRVAALESEVAALKSRIGAIDAELRALPKPINAGFRRMESRLTRVHADIAELRTAMDLRFDAALMAIAADKKD
jgi:predicted fused transcriptional regulator/phosphomethylpyrimidine kinase